MMSDQEVMRLTGFKVLPSEDRVRQLLDKWITEGDLALGVWAAEELSTGAFVGWFMLKAVRTEEPEIGFMLPQNKWGLGFATEVSKALVDHAFATMNIQKIVATTNRENISSIGVLRKIGMVLSDAKDLEDGLLLFEVRSTR